MATKKSRKPLQLAGMSRKAGMAPNGDSIEFTFQTQDDKEFTFLCPHEAVSIIVENLTILADAAWKARGSPNLADAVGTRGKARARTATGILISVAKEGIVLTLQCGPIRHDTLMPPDLCSRLAEDLGEAHKKWFQMHRAN